MPSKLQIAFPEVFSFLDNPEETLATIEGLVSACLGGAQYINLDHRKCTTVGHAAESLAGALLLDAARSKLRTRFGGTYPLDPLQREIVRAIGIPKVLGLGLETPKEFLCFHLRRGAKRSPEEAETSSRREIETTQLAEYVDACLAVTNHELTPEGLETLCNLVSEVIGNAEEHSGRLEWWIAGYMRELPSLQGECHITIFNLGLSLEESLKQLPQSSRLRMEIERLVEIHTARRIFVPSSWTEESLWTLYALQEGVSRLNVDARIGHRGQGIPDMIGFFQEIGQTLAGDRRPLMCLLSGNTHILFDGRYPLREETTSENEQRRVIAFNPKNDLSEKPDANNVRHLSHRFPGTMISMRFFLDDQHLQKIESQGDG